MSKSSQNATPDHGDAYAWGYEDGYHHRPADRRLTGGAHTAYAAGYEDGRTASLAELAQLRPGGCA